MTKSISDLLSDIGEPLRVSIRAPYGNEVIRPECERSKKFAELLGQKTLTRENVEKLKSFGYSFEVVVPNEEKRAL